MTLSDEHQFILDYFNEKLPEDYKVKLKNEIDQFKLKENSSLPHFQKNGKVTWLSVSKSYESLIEFIQNLRCWVIPSYGYEDIDAIVRQGDTELTEKILETFDGVYFRWVSDIRDFHKIIEKFNFLRQTVKKRPARKFKSDNTLNYLRQKFYISLINGNKEDVFESIKEIDDRQLDMMQNTLSLKIVANNKFGNYEAVVKDENIELLLSLKLTKKVKIALLNSYYQFYFDGISDIEKFEKIFSENNLHHKLVGIITPDILSYNEGFVKMLSLEIKLNREQTRVNELADYQEDPFVVNLRNSFSNDIEEIIEEPIPVVSTEVHENIDWTNIKKFVLNENEIEVRRFCKFLNKNISEEELIILEEILTDDETSDPKKKYLCDVLITKLIELFVDDEKFPEDEYLYIYKQLFEFWSFLKSKTSDTKDNEFFIILAEVLLTSDASLQGDVINKISSWWTENPALSNIKFIGNALELVSIYTNNKQMVDIWYDVVTKIENNKRSFSKSDLNLWMRLGNFFEIPEAEIQNRLKSIVESYEEDVFTHLNGKNIIIFSFQENAAKAAQNEIEERGNCSVKIINKIISTEEARVVENCEFILYVWRANKHSNFKALDKYKNDLVYVPGTGSSSIVGTLESECKKKYYL